MKFKRAVTFGLSATCLFAGEVFANNPWSDDVGGDYNIPPKEYNEEFHGYGSTGNIIYNKIDLQNGTDMWINGGNLYDNQGNEIGTVIPSLIGAINGGDDGRDGGIIAGAITKIEIDGIDVQVIFAWSVNIEEGGRKSGWVIANDFTPKNDIRDILQDNKSTRLGFIEDLLEDARYVEKTVTTATLPSEAEEWYLQPGRDGNAGKAKYYFTRDGIISALKNIPETGSQRFGVAHDAIPVGANFFVDLDVDEVELPIYPTSSSSQSAYSLKLVWGYAVNSSGRKWYSWVNSETLR